MTGEIIIQASCNNSSTGEAYNYFDYTVPASGGRGALDLRFVRGAGKYHHYDGGELLGNLYSECCRRMDYRRIIYGSW